MATLNGRSHVITRVDDASFEASGVGRQPAKRKRIVVDLTHDDTPPSTPKTKRSRSAQSSDPSVMQVSQEKRLRRFRHTAPGAFHTIYNRAVTQRLFVLSRERGGTAEEPEETVKLAGTTGNIYTIRIAKEPSCNCPYALQGHQCKHIVYVLALALKAPEHLQYQLALLSNELQEIFANAPLLPSKVADDTEYNGKRKPIEDDCPICCVEFNDKEPVVWCKAACGNNVHASCFEQWAKQKKAGKGPVTCPFCRTPWEVEVDTNLVRAAERGGYMSHEGYHNVGQELGLSGNRDYSSYNQRWVARQRREGNLHDEEEGGVYMYETRPGEYEGVDGYDDEDENPGADSPFFNEWAARRGWL